MGKREKQNTNSSGRRGGLLILSVILTVFLVTEALLCIIFLSRPDVKYTHSLNLGNRYLLAMDYDQAVRAFTEAIDIDPKKPEAYAGRGDAYAGLDQNDLARKDYEYAISLDPSYEDDLLPKLDTLAPVEETDNPPEITAEPTEVPEPTATPEPTPTPEPTATPTPPPLYEPPVNGTAGAYYGGNYSGNSGTEYNFSLYTSGEDPNNPGVAYIPNNPSNETAYEMWIVENDVCRLEKSVGDRTLYVVFDTSGGDMICRLYENGILIDEAVRTDYFIP